MGLFDGLFGKKQNDKPSINLNELSARANTGDKEACIELASFYYDKDDYSNAIPWFEKAFSIAPDGKIAYRLGYCWGSTDAKISFDWVVKSRNLGYNDAFEALDGMCHDPLTMIQYSNAAGHEYELYYVQSSKEKGLPIWAETEEEEEKLWRSSSDALFLISPNGDVRLTTYPKTYEGLLSYYCAEYTGARNPVKAEYLISELTKKAESDHYWAKYLLSSLSVTTLNEMHGCELLLPDEETQERYKKEIASAANVDNPDALFASALIDPWLSRSRFEKLLEATKLGNSDAAHVLFSEVKQIKHAATGDFASHDEVIWIIKLGASGSLGSSVGYMQYLYADALMEGEGDVAVDYESSMKMYRNADLNGCYGSKFYLAPSEDFVNAISSKNGYSKQIPQISLETIRGYFKDGDLTPSF